MYCEEKQNNSCNTNYTSSMCSDSVCCPEISNETTVDILNKLYKQIEKYSKSRISNLRFAFNTSKTVDEDILKLTYYSKILESYRRSLYHNCNFHLCNCKVNRIINKVKNIVGKQPINKCREDILVEERPSWILANPQCVAYAKWEKLAHQVCFDLSMDIELVDLKDLSSLIYDISMNSLVCDIVAAFSVFDKVCKLTYNTDISSPDCSITFDINKSKKECELNYQSLIETTSCDLSYKKYINLLECKLNHSIIADVYGKSLRLDIIDGNPHLVTSSNNYNICDLNFTEVSNKDCEVLSFKPQVTKYLNSYNL